MLSRNIVKNKCLQRKSMRERYRAKIELMPQEILRKRKKYIYRKFEK